MVLDEDVFQKQVGRERKQRGKHGLFLQGGADLDKCRSPLLYHLLAASRKMPQSPEVKLSLCHEFCRRRLNSSVYECSIVANLEAIRPQKCFKQSVGYCNGNARTAVERRPHCGAKAT
jgi:hypothetical protein